jgi:hypothetical protein
MMLPDWFTLRVYRGSQDVPENRYPANLFPLVAVLLDDCRQQSITPCMRTGCRLDHYLIAVTRIRWYARNADKRFRSISEGRLTCCPTYGR